MNRDQISKLMDKLLGHFDNLDLDGVCNMFAEDAKAENFTGQKASSRAEIRETMAPYFAGALGAMKFDVHDIDIDEQRRVVWTGWVLNLTNGDVTVQLPGADTFEFNEDGMIVRNSVYCKSVQPLTLTAE